MHDQWFTPSHACRGDFQTFPETAWLRVGVIIIISQLRSLMLSWSLQYTPACADALIGCIICSVLAILLTIGIGSLYRYNIIVIMTTAIPSSKGPPWSNVICVCQKQEFCCIFTIVGTWGWPHASKLIISTPSWHLGNMYPPIIPMRDQYPCIPYMHIYIIVTSWTRLFLYVRDCMASEWVWFSWLIISLTPASSLRLSTCLMHAWEGVNICHDNANATPPVYMHQARGYPTDSMQASMISVRKITPTLTPCSLSYIL